MTEKGTQDQKDDKVDKILGGLDPKQLELLENHTKEILTSQEFADFVKGKLGLESISDLNQIENLDEVLSEELLSEYIAKLLDSRWKIDLEEFDYDQIEKRNRVFNEKLLVYLSDLAKVSIEKMGKLTPEELYTLKQFLKDSYLSATDLERMSKETDFKAAYSNVNERINRLYDQHFIKVVSPTGGALISVFDARSQYYQLTSCGLFCVLKEIQEEDMGNPFIETSTEIRIFEIYQDDQLFELFIYDIIDKKLLSEITDFDIKRIFINYLKQICQEIYKELKVFVDFQKNGIEVGEGVKWNRNLVNNKTEWNRFFDNLLSNVIHLPTTENNVSNLSELIDHPNITKDSCSFYFGAKKYLIKIGSERKRAKLSINDDEIFKVYDPEKGQVSRNSRKIAVLPRPHCFILKRLSREPQEYLLSLSRRFLLPIDLLKTQLGSSILQLFCKDSSADIIPTADFKNYEEELRKLAKDVKVKQLIENFYKKVNVHYDGFVKYGK